jgi:uncharacterized protein YfaS (alpha-2-macroglobulin family)
MERQKQVVVVLVAIILLSSLAYWAISSNDNPGRFINPADNFNIFPVLADAAGMELDSPIKITSKEAMTAGQIKNIVKVLPKHDYKVKKESDNEFLLEFDKSLKPNTVYQVSIKGKEDKSFSWAFQTKRDFKVVRTLPRDRGLYVPIDSGIEIQFSYPGIEAIDDYFEITPKVEGRFEYNKNTAVFVHKGLEKNKLYTVKIKKGFGLKDSKEVLKQDYVFKFKTEADQDKGYLNFTDELLDFTTKTPQVIEVNADGSFKGKQFLVNIYKYKDKQDFIDNIKKIDETKLSWHEPAEAKIKIEESRFEKISEFTTQLQTTEPDAWYPAFLVLPDKLDVGDYLIDMSLADENWQTHVQVNDLAVYAIVGEEENLVWVNDINTSEPVQGAKVKDLVTSNLATTDADGVAVIKEKLKLEEGFERAYFKIDVKGKQLFLVRAKLNYDIYEDFYYYSSDGSTGNTDYWSYMFLDRGMYLPNDTVHVWGMAKPREVSQGLSRAVLCLSKDNYEGDFLEIQKKQIELSDFNTYEEKFEIKNLTPGSYTIDLKDGDRLITRRYFNISEYTKPAYKIDAKFDKDKIFSWETAKLSIDASFYEGTPVSGLKLKYDYYEDRKNNENQVVCDENGHAEIIYTPKVNKDEWYPESTSFNIYNAQAEDEEIYAYKNIMVFPKDVMINVKTKASDDKTKGHITVSTNRIDINKETTGYCAEDFKGEPIDMDLQVKIFEKHYDPVEIGEYYDFIDKRVVKKYRYEERRELLTSIKGRSDKKGVFKLDFPIRKEKNYEIEVTGKDTRGNKICTNTWFMLYDFYDTYRQNRYELRTDDEDKTKYRLGEEANIKLFYNDQAVAPTEKGKMLYMELKNGLKSYKVTDKTSEKFIFSDEYLPNTYICGVYFDGERIYKAGVKDLLYDFEERQLDIDVKSDKKSYRPGDTVNLDITVKKPDGTPVRAEVNISVVDESFFTLCQQDVNTAESIYDYCMDTGILLDYVSYRELDINKGGAEGGGEGGDGGLRQDFEDTAFFKSVKTDQKGKGSISFKLPDNLTSWRITYQAITSDVYAGNGTLNINAKIPFFVDLIMSDKYLIGDAPHISARAFGTGLGANDMVDYVAKLEDEKGETVEIKKSNKARKYTDIDLGPLKEGKYNITVEAKSKKHSDGVKREIQVVDSTLDVMKTDHMQLLEGIKLPAAKGFTILNFYNKSASLYYEALNSLKWSWGERVDQVLAKHVSQNMLEQGFDENQIKEKANFTSYQIDDGGIALLPYSDSDPAISAKVASLAGCEFDENALKGYFYSILEDKESTKDDVISSLWGLAALKEPVLCDINTFMKEEELNIRQNLTLGIALAELGDEAGASDIYTKTITKYGKKSGTTSYLNAKGDKNDILEITSLAAVLSTKLGANERYDLFAYVANNSGDKVLTNLEQLICISEDIPETHKVASFTYILGNQKKNIQLKGNNSFSLLVKPEEIDNIKFEGIKGDVMVSASYPSKVKDIGKTDDNIKLERGYISFGKQINTFKQSEFVKIVLKPKFSESAPEGFYEITDVLPSGLRFVSHRSLDEKICYPIHRSGQTVVFGYYYSKKGPNKDIVYYARAAVPGIYSADHAVMKHTQSNTTAITDKSIINIK